MRLLLRRLAASPGFTAVSILTLAVGIGANLAIFTVVNAVLLRPLPFPDANRLVILRHAAPLLVQMTELPMSGPLYHLYARELRTADGVMLFGTSETSFTGPENPQRVASSRVTPSFFEVLRTPPRLGRVFTDADSRPDAPPVMMLSDRLWRMRFGADPQVVGRIVDIDGDRAEIIGVMPAGFAFPETDTLLWRPREHNESPGQLGSFGPLGVARLANGQTLAQLRTELAGLTSNLVELFPDESAAPVLVNAGFTPLVAPLREWVVGDIQATLWILLGAAGFLLLIACANVANLFLVRAEARHRELSIRVALGAGRTRLVGSTLLESLLLGLGGGLVAVPLAFVAVRLLIRFGPENLPRVQEVSLDGEVLLFAAALALLAGLAFGLLPAWRAAVVLASGTLVEGPRGASLGRDRHLARRGLVIAQIALALTMLIGAGLAVRSFQRIAAVDPGFDPNEVLTFRVALLDSRYDTDAARLAFVHELQERIAGLPGVRAAAATSSTPLSGQLNGSGHSLEDRPLADGEVPAAFITKTVSPGYFDTMRIPIIEGREFDRLDEARTDRVAIVTRSIARQYWSGESALGKGLRSGGPPEGDDQDWFRVVGVVGDVRETGVQNDTTDVVYYPMTAQNNRGGVPRALSYVLRTDRVEPIVGRATETVHTVDPNLPVSNIATYATILRRNRATPAFVMVLLIIAATFALLLGATGLYGVISYLVALRQREIAIRLAIGAQLADIRRLILVEAGWMALAGTAVGLTAAVVLTRRLQALLFETTPLDPVVFVAVSTILVGVCLLASWLPARRAARVEPVTALRAE